MDRRQRKTREAIFSAFIDLLAEQDFTRITVGQIIDRADVGRATFYAHFETKDYLLKALCEDLFCHIFDGTESGASEHRHLFHCEAPDAPFLHLFRHLLQNDNRVLNLLSCPNSDLFLRYFKEHLETLVLRQLPLFEGRKNAQLPDDFWVRHIASTFAETLRWWIDNGKQETPETLHEYFLLAV